MDQVKKTSKKRTREETRPQEPMTASQTSHVQAMIDLSRAQMIAETTQAMEQRFTQLGQELKNSISSVLGGMRTSVLGSPQPAVPQSSSLATALH